MSENTNEDSARMVEQADSTAIATAGESQVVPTASTPNQVSPLPWATKQAAIKVDGAWDYAIVDGSSQVIAEAFGRTSPTNWPDSQANAAYIVRACNTMLKAREATSHGA